MSLSKQDQEGVEKMAELIDAMVTKLMRRGFDQGQSVRLVAGMLSSAVIYQPFQQVAVVDHSAPGTRH